MVMPATGLARTSRRRAAKRKNRRRAASRCAALAGWVARNASISVALTVAQPVTGAVPARKIARSRMVVRWLSMVACCRGRVPAVRARIRPFSSWSAN